MRQEKSERERLQNKERGSRREKQIDYMQDEEIVDTHSIGTDENSSIRPLALVEACVVHYPLSGQRERLEGSKRNKDSQLSKKISSQHYIKQNQKTKTCLELD